MISSDNGSSLLQHTTSDAFSILLGTKYPLDHIQHILETLLDSPAQELGLGLVLLSGKSLEYLSDGRGILGAALAEITQFVCGHGEQSVGGNVAPDKLLGKLDLREEEVLDEDKHLGLLIGDEAHGIGLLQRIKT